MAPTVVRKPVNTGPTLEKTLTFQRIAWNVGEDCHQAGVALLVK